MGLGGAHSPNAQTGTPARDITCNVSSPWVPDWPLNAFPNSGNLFTGPIWVMDEDDFIGTRTRDFDPIALPLLLEFKVYPDDATNGAASSANQFHIGHMGPLWPGTPALGCGYYNYRPLGGCAGLDWSVTRVHTTGGFDPQNNIDVKVNPDNTYQATGAWIKDMGLGDPIAGLYKTKYGDSHIHWAQADFIRKVSMATFGFIDLQRPNQAKATTTSTTLTVGIPDFTTLGANIAGKDFVTVVDPPITAQPAGTSVKIEFRGATTIPGPQPASAVNHIYDRKPNETSSGVIPTIQSGKILNPFYACDAYREAMPNAPTTPRVAAVGLTPYVVEEQIDTLRDPAKGSLPRYLNWRVVFENNTLVTPATSPSLRSMSVVYRMARFD